MEILVDTGNGVQTFGIEATRAGRRVEVSTGRGLVEVSELTRTGQPGRTGRAPVGPSRNEARTGYPRRGEV